ncbi:NUDIX hydrolase [Lottiidibacillus patelloidae]
MENKIVLALKGVIIHKGKVLIVKRSTNAHVGGGTWECVGGKLEFGEGLEEALIREAEEEIGVKITVGRLLYATTFHTSENRQVVIMTYLCECKSNRVSLSNEHSDYCWATKEELKQLLPDNIISDFETNGIFQMKELI